MGWKLYANCLVVKGIRRSTICDLQRQMYYFIPNALERILTEHPGVAIDKIKHIYGYNLENNIIIDQYFKFLFDKELIFVTDEFDSFPEITMDWDFPAKVTNAIIDFDDYDYNLEKVVTQLNELNCQSIQFRIYSEVDLSFVEGILDRSSKDRIRSIYVILKWSSRCSTESIEYFCNKFPQVIELNFHSANDNYTSRTSNDTILNYSTKKIHSEKSCGCISKKNFRTNIDLFSESKHFNNCLNRKIGINKLGQISNCPSMNLKYGNVSDTKLSTVIDNEKFKEVWSIKKDQIDVCQVCEFRYICTDCRVYTTQMSLLSKPEKCKYDPYSATWTDAIVDL